MDLNRLDTLQVQRLRESSPLDFVDIDPNYHVLKECFPNFSSDDIIDALEDADGDLNKASEILMSGGAGGSAASGVVEEEPDRDSPDFKILSLAEMFPHIEVEVVAEALKDCDYDSEKASESLLNHDLIAGFERDMIIAEVNNISNANRTWGQIHERIYQIAELTEVEINVAKSYYHKNGGNIVYALVDIIYNLKNEELKERLKRENAVKVNNTKQLPKGGRVQNGFNRNKPSYRKNLKQDDLDEAVNRYIYDENNPEVSELASLVYDDQFLVNINWEFYQESLVYFMGDVTKVISLALFISEFENGFKATYRDEFDLNKENLKNAVNNIAKTAQPPARFIQVLKKPVNDTLKRPIIEDDLSSKQIALQRVQLMKCKETNSLDLHGFHVKNAKDTTIKALNDWWQDELNAREISGNASSGTKAREIDQFVVITGKGIHSEGGHSKIRAVIKKYLENSRYYFLEEEARFIVVGLKR